MNVVSASVYDRDFNNIRKIKVIVGIDKSNLIKSGKRIVVCGKNF
ncbi:hypothetical protein [Clostridium psychrophilum]|nr:hypothetical protein [Clostridium psychrophilum]